MAEQRVIREDYRELDRYFLDSGANNIFLVCGKSIKRLPVGRYFAELEARMGLRLVRFSAFRPNPLRRRRLRPPRFAPVAATPLRR